MLLLHHLWLSKAANSLLLLSPGKEETSESSAQYVLIAEALFAKEVPKHMFVTFFFFFKSHHSSKYGWKVLFL